MFCLQCEFSCGYQKSWGTEMFCDKFCIHMVFLPYEVLRVSLGGLDFEMMCYKTHISENLCGIPCGILDREVLQMLLNIAHTCTAFLQCGHVCGASAYFLSQMLSCKPHTYIDFLQYDF